MSAVVLFAITLQTLDAKQVVNLSALDGTSIGQKVQLTSDLYGSRVVYQGVVDGFSGGTGAAFAAIPAQNATGNWIKVVQRVPVRIAVVKGCGAGRPLRPGMSVTVHVATA